MSVNSSVASPFAGFWGTGTAQGTTRSTNSRSGDPPREAREGCEWVWFPEGYWAERPLERRNSSRENGSQASQGSQVHSTVNKVFRWTPRGSRSPREQHSDLSSERPVSVSPGTITLPMSSQRFQQFMPPKNLPSSPYMSEEEQTLSLQGPKKQDSAIPNNRDTWTSLNSTAAPIAELMSPGSQLPAGSIRSQPSRGIIEQIQEASHHWRSSERHR